MSYTIVSVFHQAEQIDQLKRDLLKDIEDCDESCISEAEEAALLEGLSPDEKVNFHIRNGYARDAVDAVEKGWKQTLQNNRITVLGILIMLGVSIQSYFMYKSNTMSKGRSLLVITKSPIQFISRWDTIKEVEVGESTPETSTASHIVDLTRSILDSEFVEYKFNENVFIRINTIDVKTDEAEIKLNESSVIKDTIDMDKGNDE